MKLRSSSPWWSVKHGLLTVVPPLENDITCDVLIVGSGITGALLAHRFREHNIDFVLVDSRDIAMGSTSASTALLQYDIDVPLSELADKVGLDHAERAYRAGIEAIDHLEIVAAEVGEASFARRPSLYVTREENDTDFMRQELGARLAAGIEVDWVDHNQLSERWGIKAAGGIHSAIAAQVDPFSLTHRLLRRCMDEGIPIHDRTAVTDITEFDNAVRVTTDRAVVHARWVVMATGYESVRWLKQRVVDLNSTYAVISEPLPAEQVWRDRPLLWEHATPYLYARWTDDHRLIFGGADSPFKDETLRDNRIDSKCRDLTQDLAILCPGLPIEPAFAWAGTFGTTHDGLAYIGLPPERQRVLFALGYGGNGITFSEIASRIITDHIRGKAHQDAPVFAFTRTEGAYHE